MSTRNLFKALFTSAKKSGIKSCGNYCHFFDEEGSEKVFSFKDARLIQSRVMRYLYFTGFRLKRSNKSDTFGKLIKEINKFGHEACKPERLSEKDHYSVSNLIVE